MGWLAGFAAQMVLVLMKLFGGIEWSWWIVLAPFEIVAIVVATLFVWLLFTSSNPFQ